MRVLRDHRCVCAAVSPSITTQHSLEDATKLWADWGIHALILVSLGIQFFLFLAAGLRRRVVSRVLRSLLWLAYLSADFVAVFILGHLSVHASGSRHRLLFLWAPLVLLHLGGQYTITAFSMQDNELWRRHLLGLVSQVVVAGYVVSRSSWPDGRIRAAMVLMFLSGCLRYAERTLCLYKASPAKLKESALRYLTSYMHAFGNRLGPPRESSEASYQSRIWAITVDDMLKTDGWRPSYPNRQAVSSRASALVSGTPLSDINDCQVYPSFILGKLQEFKSTEHRCRAYNYVATHLLHVYEHLYTKAPHPLLSIFYQFFTWLEDVMERKCNCRWTRWPVFCPILYLPLLFQIIGAPLLVLFPFLSTSATLILVVIAKQSQLYSQADVLVSAILLIGAITLEVASLFIAYAPNSIHPKGGWSTKQWSEMLGQYNMIKSLTRKDDASGIMSFVPQWISNRLDDKTITHIPIYQDLKMFVLDKLLEFGTRKEDWKFASFRGQLALRKWNLPPGSETALHRSINDVEFPRSVLIWHVATDILYFQLDNTNTNSAQQQMKKKMSRELSNYIMYLVFKCGVMLTNNIELLHNNALKDMEFGVQGEKDAMGKVFQANKTDHHTTTNSELPDKIQPRKDIVEACEVAQELIDIHGEVNCWDLIAAVWLEMLYYIAPRCGSDFHSEQLATGGEFITHVLVLMQYLGPFLTPSVLQL